MLGLKLPTLPVSGAAAPMGHGDDLHGCCCWPVNYRVGKTAEEKLPCGVQVRGPTLRTFQNSTDRLIECRHESIPRNRIALGVPQIGSSCLGDSFRMQFNAWTSHRTVRGSGDVQPTRERSSPFPYPTHRGGARSPHPTPLPRLHLRSHPGFQSDDPQALLGLQQVNGELLLRPFCAPDSWRQFYIRSSRQHKFRLSEARWLRN